MKARSRRTGRRGRTPGQGPPLTVEVVSSGQLRARGLGRWLGAVAPAGVRGEVTVGIVSDARVRALNRRYRKRDAATDVLSFPAEAGSPKPEARSLKPGALLGDILIAGGVARRQALRAGHSVQVELRVLALHGLLHLLGYDHERDDGRMARLERRLRRKGRLGSGLIERGHL